MDINTTRIQNDRIATDRALESDGRIVLSQRMRTLLPQARLVMSTAAAQLCAPSQLQLWAGSVAATGDAAFGVAASTTRITSATSIENKGHVGRKAVPAFATYAPGDRSWSPPLC